MKSLNLQMRDELNIAAPVCLEYSRGTAMPIGVNLTIEKAVETAATQPKPARQGLKKP
jgi:hypothetical protein